VLAVEVAVVCGEEQVGVVELAAPAQRLDEPAHALVHREQRLELAAVLALDLGHALGRQPGHALDLRRLVGDVRLVEAGRARQRLVVERVRVPRGRLGDAVAVARRVRVRVGSAAV
jgi:hypothetical protein